MDNKFDLNDMVDFFAGTPARVIVFDENGPQEVNRVSQMSEEEFESFIQEEICIMSDLNEDASKIDRVCSFSDEMLLTSNKGIIVKMKDGSEFQMTIKRRK
jgi:hypothetical protein